MRQRQRKRHVTRRHTERLKTQRVRGKRRIHGLRQRAAEGHRHEAEPEAGVRGSQTPERKKTVAFSAPYNYQSLGIEAAEGSPVKDENTLGGTRIGVVQGTVSDTWVADHDPTAQIVRFPNDAAALSALKTKAVDGAVFDLATAETYASENPEAKLKVVHSITTDLPHGYAFKKGNTDLINKINAGLKQVIDDGTWEKLHKQFEPNAPTPKEFAAKS